MTVSIPTVALLAFLPFVLSLFGRGVVWKSLCLLLCIGSLFTISVAIGGLFSWLLAWICAIGAISNKRQHKKRLSEIAQLLNQGSDATLMKNVRRSERA